MKALTRVLVVHSDASLRTRILYHARAQGFWADEAASGPQALEMVCHLRPDVLILSLTLPLQDGLSVLEDLRLLPLRHLPYILSLSALGSEQKERALALGSDAVLAYPFSPEDVIRQVSELSAQAFSRLALFHADARMDSAREIVSQTGMNPALKGYEYLSRSLSLCSVCEDLIDSTTTCLYPHLASVGSTRPAAVERAIRHAIESTWTHGRVETLNALFGNSVHPQRGKPTNTECIARLCDRLLEKLEGNR